MPKLKAPMVYFGGKSRVTGPVWKALGDVEHYIEPFAGSLAVLLERPSWHRGRVETVNDMDSMLVNFWRALAADPEGVAKHCDWPVMEQDLTARHLWLVNQGKKIVARCEADPDFYDVKIAGWWVWGINAWIGSGWCSGNGPWMTDEDGDLIKADRDRATSGEHRKLPSLGHSGQGTGRKSLREGKEASGVRRKLPSLGGSRGTSRKSLYDEGAGGVHRQLPRMGSGSGVHAQRAIGDADGVPRQRPHLGSAGQGINRKLPQGGTHGVSRQIPLLASGAGVHAQRTKDASGVHRQRPHLGDAGQGINRKLPQGGTRAADEIDEGTLIPKSIGLRRYLATLANRLREVRVCCGDYSRVLTDGAMSYGSTVGIFLDPPYLGEVRSKDLYAHDDHDIAHAVREWAIEHGEDPRLRIVLAGYETEHGAKMPKGWSVHAYKARASYQSSESAKRGDGVEGNLANRKLERLWFSPHCLSAVRGLLY